LGAICSLDLCCLISELCAFWNYTRVWIWSFVWVWIWAGLGFWVLSGLLNWVLDGVLDLDWVEMDSKVIGFLDWKGLKRKRYYEKFGYDSRDWIAEKNIILLLSK